MNAPHFPRSISARPDAQRHSAFARICAWREWDSPAATMRWQALAETASTPNPFFEPWYLLSALHAFDPAGEARLLVVESGDTLIGLMPLASVRRYGRWPLPHLAPWLHANAFLGAPLVRAGYETAFWAAALALLDRTARSALFLHLPAMPLDHRLTTALNELAAMQGRTAALVMREERALLHSALSPDAYLEAALTGKKRKELRRQHARLAELGDLTFERRDDAHGISTWIEDFLVLERAGWKGRAGSAMACAPETAGLFRNALMQAARLGKLERLTLALDGRPIAMLANFLTPPGSFSFKTAFDESWARFSPGVLLQRENLALLLRDGIAWCDSCAAPDHPMIDSLWTERRAIGRISVGLGGSVRQALFNQMVARELGRNPTGIV